MRRMIIIKTGSSLPSLVSKKGDFEHWILSGMGLSPEQAYVINVYQDDPLPDPGEVSGAVVTGSHAMVTEHQPWSERTAEWLAAAVEQRIPVLGICYGHQLLAYALGGEVQNNPNGLEYGMVQISLNENCASDPLFRGLPSQIQVHASHTQSVVKLPDGAVHLASSDLDPNQAFAVGESAWGVQFHPEFDAEIARTYIHHSRGALAEAGRNPDLLLRSCEDNSDGAEILKRFFRRSTAWI